MKIDAHVYVGESIFGYGQAAEAILKNLDRLELDKCLLIPVKPYRYHLAPENDFVARTVKEHPDRFIGFTRVDPRQGKEAVREMSRGIETLELKGLYLDPWEETFPANSELVYPLMEMAGRLRVPVMLRGGYPLVSHPGQVEEIARRFPETSIIATSGGQINISGGALMNAKEMLVNCPNVYMETSGIYREDFIEEMAKVLGASRLIYGSGSPVFDMNFEILRVTTAHLTEDGKAMILGGSLARILNLQGRV